MRRPRTNDERIAPAFVISLDLADDASARARPVLEFCCCTQLLLSFAESATATRATRLEMSSTHETPGLGTKVNAKNERIIQVPFLIRILVIEGIEA